MYDLTMHNILLKEAEGYQFTVFQREKIKRTQETILIDAFLDAVVTEKLEFTDEEIKKFFEVNDGRYYLEKSVMFDTIFLNDISKAKDILKFIHKDNFEQVKYDYDVRLERPKIQWLGYSRIRADIRDRISKLVSGHVDPTYLEADNGYYIILLIDKKDERKAKFEEVEELIRKEYTDVKYKEIKDEVINELLTSK